MTRVGNIFLRISVLSLFAALLPANLKAQYAWQEEPRTPSRECLADGLRYAFETQMTASHGKTPLWLNANRQGLSSLKEYNGYVRGAVERPLSTDSARRWAIGYGVDVAVPLGYTSHFIVQQAYAEARWLHGVLSIGAKEYPMALKNQTLSSGSQTLGINARPVPQVRLALPEYWPLPFVGRWLQFKGHLAYGVMTDDGWQHDFTEKRSKYADRVLYHSKSGYLRFGRDEDVFPLNLEVGLEMATLFGGHPYRPGADGQMEALPTGHGWRDFWHALIPGGSDVTDGAYPNNEGNVVGSWVARINYNTDMWRLSLYADHFFEDHSQMFFLDYNGYGEGDRWNAHERHRYFVYSLKDIMLGAEVSLKYGRWLRNVVFEYLYTKYQSGPYNHDHTMNIPDHIAGTDDYYNHSIYGGWQHWGQVMGNPLYRSPLYNTDGSISVRDNRFVAFHLGFDGQPSERVAYRVLATWQKGWGTYADPFTRAHQNVSFLTEASYSFGQGWKATVGYGMDFGSERMLGHNAGLQVTVRKSGLFKRR